MPSTIGTLERPSQLCQDMYSKLAKIQELLQKHARAKAGGRVETNKEVIESVEILASELDKFNVAFFRQIYRDAQKIASLANNNPAAVRDVEMLLGRLENLFKLLKKAHRDHLKREHFFVSFSHKLANLVKRLTKGVKGLEKKHHAMMKKHVIGEAKKNKIINIGEARKKKVLQLRTEKLSRRRAA